MNRNFIRAILALPILALATLPLRAEDQAPAAPAKAAAKAATSSTADHSRFKELEGPFASGPEVTRACLNCHTEAAKQIHKTKHWTWEYVNPETGQKLGKKNVINNFCTSTTSNEAFCSSCHIGYGWKDASFDFSQETAVDCVVCHDTTGTYKKIPGLAGHPTYAVMEWPPKSGKFIEPPDLANIAQNVGKTSRQTCGTCHFYGGGGNGVKHGDLDSSLNKPPRYLDVHMEADGLNFQCSNCHVTDGHEVSGSRYTPTALDSDGRRLPGKDYSGKATTCESCHGSEPHPDKANLNTHARKLACQTCHIPAYARGPLHTKMSWDWSTAGRTDENGKRIRIKGSEGRDIYDSNKGDFTYDRYVIPEYQWFNGQVEYTLFGDKVDGSELVKINEFKGSPNDPDSKIWPVRVFRGKQPYDKGNQTLGVLHTTGDDDAAFWGNFDWQKSLTVGMDAAGVPFSGEFGFVSTEMSWPITHMVAPKEDALRCEQCHTDHGRMASVEGVYLPGRDRVALLDGAGGLIALFSLLGVAFHGGIRIIMNKRRG